MTVAAVSALPSQRGHLARLRLTLGSIGAAALGVAPHVLHHVGPLAGAALLGGAGGTLLFGAAGLVLAVPMLVRVGRRTGSWRVPAALLALFAVVFTMSATVVGPALAGDGDNSANPPASTAPDRPSGVSPGEHETHHP